jgi:hypothetical protein
MPPDHRTDLGTGAVVVTHDSPQRTALPGTLGARPLPSPGSLVLAVQLVAVAGSRVPGGHRAATAQPPLARSARRGPCFGRGSEFARHPSETPLVFDRLIAAGRTRAGRAAGDEAVDVLGADATLLGAIRVGRATILDDPTAVPSLAPMGSNGQRSRRVRSRRAPTIVRRHRGGAGAKPPAIITPAAGYCC